jgi:hypothetical protein
MWSSPGQRRWRYGAALGVETKVPTERGARAGVRTPPSGRPRGLVRSYYEGLPSMAAFNGCTKLRTGEAKAWPRPKGPKPQSGRMGPRTEIAADWSARWRTRSQGRVPPQGGLKYKDAPFGAPAPHFFEGQKEEGLPGADTRIRAMTRGCMRPLFEIRVCNSPPNRSPRPFCNRPRLDPPQAVFSY